jgi:hypothetical protein
MGPAAGHRKARAGAPSLGLEVVLRGAGALRTGLEIVLSVDVLNVLDGKTASFNERRTNPFPKQFATPP